MLWAVACALGLGCSAETAVPGAGAGDDVGGDTTAGDGEGDAEAGGGELFSDPVPCSDAATVPLAGSGAAVIAALEIGVPADGLDLDGDGQPDNKLGNLGPLTQDALADAIKSYDLLVAPELFALELSDGGGAVADECVKVAVYLAQYRVDADADGDMRS